MKEQLKKIMKDESNVNIKNWFYNNREKLDLRKPNLAKRALIKAHDKTKNINTCPSRVFDENGNLIKNITKTKNGCDEISEFVYDENGNILESCSSIGKLISGSVRTYDENDNILTISKISKNAQYIKWNELENPEVITYKYKDCKNSYKVFRNGDLMLEIPLTNF